MISAEKWYPSFHRKIIFFSVNVKRRGTKRKWTEEEEIVFYETFGPYLKKGRDIPRGFLAKVMAKFPLRSEHCVRAKYSNIKTGKAKMKLK